jgi:hypothetical protein
LPKPNRPRHLTSNAQHEERENRKKNAKRNGHRVLAGQLEMPREPPRLFLSQSLKNFFFFVFVVFQHEQRSNKQTNKQTNRRTDTEPQLTGSKVSWWFLALFSFFPCLVALL